MIPKEQNTPGVREPTIFVGLGKKVARDLGDRARRAKVRREPFAATGCRLRKSEFLIAGGRDPLEMGNGCDLVNVPGSCVTNGIIAIIVPCNGVQSRRVSDARRETRKKMMATFR